MPTAIQELFRSSVEKMTGLKLGNLVKTVHVARKSKQ